VEVQMTTTAIATAQAATPVSAAARPARTEIRQPKALPVPDSDFYQLSDALTAEERAIVKTVRAYMETKVAPMINKYWSDDAFPFELLPSFKELQIGGLGYQGYGCAGGSQKLFGFVAMELARVDASFCTFFGVHSGLAMGSICLDGSEEQKQKWLPAMARGEKIGWFGLTEPLVASGTRWMTRASSRSITHRSRRRSARPSRARRWRGAASCSAATGSSPATTSRASSPTTWKDPRAALEAARDDAAVRGVILTGAGDKAAPAYRIRAHPRHVPSAIAEPSEGSRAMVLVILDWAAQLAVDSRAAQALGAMSLAVKRSLANSVQAFPAQVFNGRA
jgi:Acyl-CoA dehydrogenase, N-terminal domain